MNSSKQAPGRRLAITIVHGPTAVADSLAYRRAVATEEFAKGLQVIVVAVLQPVTPGFGVAKDPLRPAIVGAERIERPADGLGIGLPHQLAYQLALSPLCPVRPDGSRGDYRSPQWRFKLDAIELLVSQADEPLAERL